MKKNHKIFLFMLVLFTVGSITVFSQTGARGGRRKSSEPSTYTLTINSNVRDARIYIDNVQQKGSIPYSVTLEAGTYTVSLRHPDWVNETVTVNLNENTRLQINLKRQVHDLTIQSNVGTARIYLNGDLQQASPPHTFRLDRGRYNILLQAEGYDNGSATIDLKQDQTIRINLNPLKATIVPAKHHPDFIIIIDGKQQGSGPVQVLPGTHTIEFRIGALSAKGTYTFEAGQTYRVQPTLGIDFNY